MHQRPYKKTTITNSEDMAPIRMVTVGKTSAVPGAHLETKYKCFSAQFCGMYNVPGSAERKKPFKNVLVPRYGMFNAEECYVYQHDAAVQNSRKPVVQEPVTLNGKKESFNLELDFMLDKFDSDTEDASVHTQNDINKIAGKYQRGGIPGMVDWEDMVSSIADGALDMSGSRRIKREKKSTKLRSPTIFTDTRKDTESSSVSVKPSDLDQPLEDTEDAITDVLWYDVNSLRFRDN